MRQRQNILLTGVAALALIAGAGAGAGVAAAQQGSQGQNGSPGMSGRSGIHAQTAKPGAAAGMEQHAQTSTATGAKAESKTGGSAALNAKGANQPAMAQKSFEGPKGQSMARKGPESAKGQRSARELKQNKMGSEAKKTAESRHEHLGANERAKRNEREHLGANARIEHNGTTARNQHERRGHMSTARRTERSRTKTAQRNERNLKGLQGNASIPMQGSHVNLTHQQRTKIRESVIDARNAPRAGHVNFNIRVGTLVPREHVHVVPVPETLVRIDPRWRGYDYFIVEDQVIIVNPRDMRIVAVIDV